MGAKQLTISCDYVTARLDHRRYARTFILSGDNHMETNLAYERFHHDFCAALHHAGEFHGSKIGPIRSRTDFLPPNWIYTERNDKP